MIFKDLYSITQNLITVQKLYADGLRGNDKEIQTYLEAAACCADKLEHRYTRKFDLNKRLEKLLSFSNIRLTIYNITQTINCPEDYHSFAAKPHLFFYEDITAKKSLEVFFKEIDVFIEQNLSKIITDLNSVLEKHSLINLDNLELAITDDIIESIKIAIRNKILNQYDALEYKTLELYYYPPEELQEAPFKRLAFKTDSRENNFSPYYEHLLNEMPFSKLIEIACDFNIPFQPITIQSKKQTPLHPN
jgi:hypothetical protein